MAIISVKEDGCVFFLEAKNKQEQEHKEHQFSRIYKATAYLKYALWLVDPDCVVN